MKEKIKWFLYFITVVYFFFIIGPLKSPSPYRSNILFHIIYLFILLVGTIIIIYKSRK